MIARLEVKRGDLTEYPLAEKARGGWQNGVTFYPDADVTKVTPLQVVAPEPQAEPSDAQVEAAVNAHRYHRNTWGSTEYASMRAALRAAGRVQ